MADINVTRSLGKANGLTEDDVRTTLVRCLDEDFENLVGQPGGEVFSCDIKAAISVIKLQGRIRVSRMGDSFNVLIEADSGPSLGLWLQVVVACFFPPLFFVVFWLYISQKNQAAQDFEGALRRADFIGTSASESDRPSRDSPSGGKYCTSCGNPASASERFCRNCGAARRGLQTGI